MRVTLSLSRDRAALLNSLAAKPFQKKVGVQQEIGHDLKALSTKQFANALWKLLSLIV